MNFMQLSQSIFFYDYKFLLSLSAKSLAKSLFSKTLKLFKLRYSARWNKGEKARSRIVSWKEEWGVRASFCQWSWPHKALTPFQPKRGIYLSPPLTWFLEVLSWKVHPSTFSVFQQYIPPPLFQVHARLPHRERKVLGSDAQRPNWLTWAGVCQRVMVCTMDEDVHILLFKNYIILSMEVVSQLLQEGNSV